MRVSFYRGDAESAEETRRNFFAQRGRAPRRRRVGLVLSGLAVVVGVFGSAAMAQKGVADRTRAGGAEFFGAPKGKPSGNGSISNPWDLATALGSPGLCGRGARFGFEGGRM